MTIQQLREKIANLATQANHMLNEKGDAKWTPENQVSFDKLTNEINDLKAQIKNIETMRELEAENFLQNPGTQKPEDGSTSIKDAVALYLRNGDNASAAQWEVIRNAMSTTTGSEGGFTVPKEVAAMVIDRLKAFGGMRELAEILTTDSGSELTFPGSDGTAEVGEIVGENADVAEQDIAFNSTVLNPYMYSSKLLALPLQLIQDSGIDIVSFVINRLATRIARIQNLHFTIGTGTGQPFGVIPRAGAGKNGATGQTLTVVYDDLVDLKHSVNRAYRQNARYMLNDLTVATVSKLKDTTGRPIWVPSVDSIVPDTLLGFAVAINDDVPVMAAGAKSIAFGDFSKYAVRDVAGTTTMRRFDDSPFARKAQAGFCGWQRSGGNLLDPNAVKVYTNSAT